MTENTRPTQPTQQFILLGGFVTDPECNYDPQDAQYCLMMAQALKLLEEYVKTLATDAEPDVFEVMTTPWFFAKWLNDRKLPELKIAKSAAVIGSDAYNLADIALDNAEYLMEQLKTRRIFVVSDQTRSAQSTMDLLLDDQ